MKLREPLHRRTFLIGSGAALGLGLAGCFPGKGQTGSAGRSFVPNPDIPVVDMHCHIFNAQDIDLPSFLGSKIHWGWAQNTGDILSKWFAPSAVHELAVLKGQERRLPPPPVDHGLELARLLTSRAVDHAIAGASIRDKRDDLAGVAGLSDWFLAEIAPGVFAANGTPEELVRAGARHKNVGLDALNRAGVCVHELILLGKEHESRGLAGARVLSDAELDALDRTLVDEHVREFETLYGKTLDEHIMRLEGSGRPGNESPDELRAWNDSADRLVDELKTKSEAPERSQSWTKSLLARAGKTFLGKIWSHVRGYKDLFANMFHYRERLAKNLAATYAPVSLFTPSTVDFSFWKGDKDRTRSHLREQIRVQSELAKVSLRFAVTPDKSRKTPVVFLPFIAFNPLREVLYPSGPYRKGAPLDQLHGALELARAAVLEHGFVGVKLYPPSGFALLGNAGQRKSDDGSLEKLAQNLGGAARDRWMAVKDTLGEHLDQALRALYRFCVAADVPIMAHSNNSNAFEDGYGWCSGPYYWHNVLTDNGGEFANLRVCMGHFGHFTGTDSNGDPAAPAPTRGCFGPTEQYPWSYDAAKLFTYPNVYVDLANTDINGDAERAKRLGTLLSKLDATSSGQVRKRLLYGSDWFMNNTLIGFENSLGGLESVFTGVWGQDDGVVADLMGANALRYLGLAAGEPSQNLQRVRDYYDGLPAWL